MNYSVGSKPTHEYRQIQTVEAVAGASASQLIQMLFEGALERLATAKGHMLRGETATKGEQLSRVIAILDGLRGSLNREAGGELAEHLDDLYHYMQHRLLQGNAQNDLGALDEVIRLLTEIKGAWGAMTGTARKSKTQPQGSIDSG